MKIIKINNVIEKDILIGCIVSDPFIKKIYPILELNLIDIQTIKIVMKWVLSYFERYKEAPKNNIQNIFEDKKPILKDSDAIWIEEFLCKLSDKYEHWDYNEAYLFDRAVNYLKSQKISLGCKQTLSLLDEGKVEEASLIYQDSFKTAVKYDLDVDVFDLNFVFDSLNNERRPGITLGIDSLDELVGELKSGWLVIYTGPMKRGKTKGLVYTALRGYYLGKKVVFISLESEKEDVGTYFWQGLSSLPLDERSLIYYGFFNDGNFLEFEEMMREKITYNRIRNSINIAKGVSGGSIRLKTFPAFSATISDIEDYLNSLEVYDNFCPDIICIDYIGILRAERNYSQRRDELNFVSTRMKGLAQERDAIIFSGWQGQRKTLEKDVLSLSVVNVAEDIRILANTDVMLSLNQTEEEKDLGLLRIGVLAHRWRRCPSSVQVEIAQNLNVGQFALDSRLIRRPEKMEDLDFGQYDGFDIYQKKEGF